MQLGPVVSDGEHTFRWTVDSFDLNPSHVNKTITYGHYEWRIDIHKFHDDNGIRELVIEDCYAVRCSVRPKVASIAKNNSVSVYHQSYCLQIIDSDEVFWAVQVQDEFPLSQRLWIPGKLIHVKGFDVVPTHYSDESTITFELLFSDSSDEEEKEDGLVSSNEVGEKQETLKTKSLPLYNDAGDVLDAISGLLLDDDDCDVTLIVKERRFKAHKNILKSRSEVFKRMFQCNMTEKVSGQVEISDCSPDAFEIYLRYVYSGTVNQLTNRAALDLHYIADKYDAKKLSKHCIHYLENNLTIEDISDVASFVAVNSQERRLTEVVVEFLAKNFKLICETKKWTEFVVENPVAANSLFGRVHEYLVSFS